jgi:Centromere DNA-binding protein complex CBF3 subunit, domain 2
MHCRDPLYCVHRAFSYLFIHRFTLSNEPLPPPEDDVRWNNTPLFLGNDPMKNICYQVSYKAIKQKLRELNINISKVTHAFRVAGARRLDELGIDDAVIERFGKWIRTAMLKSYLLVFKPCGLLAMGDWPEPKDRWVNWLSVHMSHII